MNLSILLLLQFVSLLYDTHGADSYSDGRIRHSQDYRLEHDDRQLKNNVQRRSAAAAVDDPPLQPSEEGGSLDPLITIEYTLVTANSPDCESSLSDSFPIRVQYRKVEDNAANNLIEWIDSPFQPTFLPG